MKYEEPSEEAKNARAEYYASKNMKPKIIGLRRISKEEARIRKPIKEHQDPYWDKK